MTLRPRARLAVPVVAAAIAMASSTLAQTPPVVTHERQLIGHTWSGGESEVVPGFEGLGGGYVRDGLAISFMRGIQDRRQWVMIAKREVGRAEPHAIWTATDAVRGTARSAQSHIAFGCRIIGSSAQDTQPGLIGVIGSERIGSPGLYRAELAWQLGQDGRLTAVTQAVGCYDEGEGV
ncbi:MAG: hypothetical protein JHC81_10280 [Brevundimonas sp.]|uniref:hypothetical protein n=1 Tax=Brevundimonas sp. TaxID=1871086 RepID=UPI001A2D474D|nr:hypothetical protein [Brevundimonas sp.]MBJ7447909.1 hypothetical protein [Brevundimonas sp.]